jgi:ribonuclease BN (tRNA processing enzyme)
MGQVLANGDDIPFEADLSTYFDVTPISEGSTLHFGSVEVTPFEVPHVPGRKSWGYAMTDNATGGKAMFTCDSMFCMDNILRFGQGADVIFHDCEFLTGNTIHTPLSQLLTLSEEWQERMVLVHYGDEWRDFEGKTGKMQLGVEGVPLTL